MEDNKLLIGGIVVIALLIAIPAGTLPPGAYTVTLVGARANNTWPLYVK